MIKISYSLLPEKKQEQPAQLALEYQPDLNKGNITSILGEDTEIVPTQNIFTEGSAVPSSSSSSSLVPSSTGASVPDNLPPLFDTTENSLIPINSVANATTTTTTATNVVATNTTNTTATPNTTVTNKDANSLPPQLEKLKLRDFTQINGMVTKNVVSKASCTNTSFGI